MSNKTETTQATVRLAEEIDIPGILSLVLTSFRQFPLFSSLYNPLDNSKDKAHDTVFFWRRRVLLDLLDPAATILVAEVPKTSSPTNACPLNSPDPGELESWQMLEWVMQNQQLSQVSKKTPEGIIVGFAIWKDRLGVNAGSSEHAVIPKADWISRLRVTLLNLEISFWSIAYQRRDIDPVRYQEYIEAENILGEQFYQERCYYLDNLCVDSRYQRLGIGTLLLGWGREVARERKLSIGTEASIKGIGPYRKMGFEQVGLWRFSKFELPVTKLAAP